MGPAGRRPKVGILALQGAVGRHAEALVAAGARPTEVRAPADLTDLDALVFPGGESTTMSKLLVSSHLFEPVAERLAGGLPALGTCAGMILLASEVADGRPDQRCFAAIDIGVRRNAFGRQLDSFEADLDVADLDVAGADVAGDDDAGDDGAGGGHRPFRGVFIRAPVVERVGDGVAVLASVDGRPVLCRQGGVTVAAFHPELSGDARLHRRFVDAI